MSPQEVSGGGVMDTRSDVYTMGVLLPWNDKGEIRELPVTFLVAEDRRELDAQLDVFRRERSQRAVDARRMAARWCEIAQAPPSGGLPEPATFRGEPSAGALRSSASSSPRWRSTQSTADCHIISCAARVEEIQFW